jgi:hypothetical protein
MLLFQKKALATSKLSYHVVGCFLQYVLVVKVNSVDTQESAWTFAEPSRIYYVDGQKVDAVICNQCLMYVFIELKQWEGYH